MNNYYFTFGQSHETKAGIRMKDRWIRVVAGTQTDAGLIFMERFCKINMHSINEWSMVYTDLNFKREYFPLGEYLLLNKDHG